MYDDVDPEAICQTTTIDIGNGPVTIDTTYINDGSYDEGVGIDTMFLNQYIFDCDDLGTPSVTLTVVDKNGNEGTCNVNITVEDNVDPYANCIADTTLYLDDDGLASLIAADFDNGSTDTCTLIAPAINHDGLFDCDSIGDITVTLTVEDLSGNSSTCDVIVTVADSTPPDVITQAFTLELGVDGTATLLTSDINDGTTDNCTINSMWLSQSEFDCSDLEEGEHEITLSVNDINGNTGTNTATVTVVNWNEPIITCVAQAAVYLDDDGIAVVEENWTLVETWSATCNDSVDLMLELDIDTFYCVDILGVDVVLTVTDTSGNFTTCELIISAIDTIVPDPLCAPTTVYLDATGNASIVAADVDGGSTDNCSIDSIWLDDYDFDCGDLGSPAPSSSTKSASVAPPPSGGAWVMLTVMDVSDNTATCYAAVTVLDTIAPNVVLHDTVVYLDASGDFTLFPEDIFVSSDEACGIDSMRIDQYPWNNPALDDEIVFGCDDLESSWPSEYGGYRWPILLTAWDLSGNYNEYNYAWVTVLDTVSPTASCVMDFTVQLDVDGLATIIEADLIDDGSWDNDDCNDLNFSLDTVDFDCSDVGNNPVVLTVTDYSGNSSTCTSTIIVEDNVAPTAVCNETSIIYLDEFGEVTVTAPDLDGGSWDACGIDTLIILEGEQLYTGADIGVLDTLTLEVTDVNGNSSTCMTSVMVVDEVAPIVNCNTIDILLFDDGRYVLKDADFAALSAGSTDNVDSLALAITALPQAFDCADITKDTWIDVTATDLSGNESTCRVLVTVNDENPLWVDAVDSVQVEVAAGVCTTVIDYPVFVSSACVTWEQTAGLGAEGDFPLGVTVETWTGTDPYDETVEVSFVVEVTTTNAAPTVDAVADTTVLEDAAVVVVMLDGISAGIDCDDQTVAVTAMGMNAALVSGIAVDYTAPDSTGTVSLTLAPDMSGTDTITVYVEDSAGDSTSVMFVVSVTAVNDLPTIDAIADVEVDEDTPMATVMLSGISSGAANEVQTLTVTAMGGNTALVSDVAVTYTSADATGTLELTIVPLMSGTDTITVTVSDSVDTVTETFVLTVVDVNHAPVVVLPIDDQSVNASYELTVSVDGVFDDVDGDELTLMAMMVGDSVWMPLAATTFSYTPMIADTGCVMFVVKATDPDGAMAMDTFEVCVLGYPTAINSIDAGSLEVTMYPNPTRGMVTMDLNSSSVYDVELAVMDITGRMILRQQYSAAGTISFDMSNQVSGMYFVQLGIDGKVFNKKLILDRK